MLSEQLADVVATFWTEVLRAEIRRLESDEPSPVRTASVTATIHIEGGGRHTVLLMCSPTLARALAGLMFKIEPEKATDDDVNDAMGEIANIVGGNLKATFPAPNSLSLPEVARGGACGGPAWQVPSSLGQARFNYYGEPLLVALTPGG